MQVMLWCAVVLVVGCYIAGPLNDPDLWWHIASGRWIVAHGAAPHFDYWNLYGAGKPWRAYSWSNAAVFSLVEHHLGITGLVVLQTLEAVALAATLSWVMSRLSRDWFVGLGLGCFATLSCFNHYTLRPQSLVWILFAALLCVLDSVEREGLTRRRIVQLVIIFCVWANSHLTAALGCATVVAWLTRIPEKGEGWFSPANMLMVRTLAWSFAGTLLTPYFGGEWITFFLKSSHPIQLQSIAEFGPATILMYSTAFPLMGLTILGVFLYRQPRAIEPLKLLYVLGYVLGGLAVIKFMPMMVILICAAIAQVWARAGGSEEKLGPLAGAVSIYRPMVKKIPAEGMTFVLVALAWVYSNDDFARPINLDLVPVEAVDFMQSHDLPGPMLNDFGSGGYLMYRYSDASGNPSRLVSIDGRTNVNPPEVWEKFSASFSGRPDWRGFIDLVKPKTILWKRQSPFYPILATTKDWCIVALTGNDDQGHVVFLRRDLWEERRATMASENCGEPESPSAAPKPSNPPSAL